MQRRLLTPQDVVSLGGGRGPKQPISLSYSPNGKYLAYLSCPAGFRVLALLDTKTWKETVLVGTSDVVGNTEEAMPLAEKLRRERQRERGVGVTQYTWAPQSDSVLLPMKGALFLKTVTGDIEKDATKSMKLLVDIDEDGNACESPAFSPDGHSLAFVQNDDLHTLCLKTGKRLKLTQCIPGKTTNGLAEYVAQEEMDREVGYWWSPNSKLIAFTEVHYGHIPPYHIVHQATDSVEEETHFYPFTGKDNATVRVGILCPQQLENGVTWLDIDQSEYEYVARVYWLKSSSEICVVLSNRAQTKIELVLFSATTGKKIKVLSSETSSTYVNLHNMFCELTHGQYEGHIVWGSERSGFMHLYRINRRNPEEPHVALTQGAWIVDTLLQIRTETNMIFFMGNKADPREKHLYTTSLDGGGDCTQVTTVEGTHTCIVSRDSDHFVDTFNNLTSPSHACVKTFDGEVVYDFPADYESFAPEPPELFSFNTADGVHLYGALYKPPEDTPKPWPTIVSVYGGPHAQRVAKSWMLTMDIRAHLLAQKGFLVMKLDNRGSSRRGLAFEGAIKNNLGDLELRDQLECVDWLVRRGYCDPRRVGMYGWSYGGYLSAMAVCRKPFCERIRVAVAGAPVTHWDGYDTHYTERYMETPETNSAGYVVSSVLHHVADMPLDAKLLIIHGMIDENVHFRHSARLINALNTAQKPYDSLMLPNERHLPRGPRDRVYMEMRLVDYFASHL